MLCILQMIHKIVSILVTPVHTYGKDFPSPPDITVVPVGLATLCFPLTQQLLFHAIDTCIVTVAAVWWLSLSHGITGSHWIVDCTGVLFVSVDNVLVR